MVVAPPKRITAEELMAIPDDGIRRWIDRGELVEEGYENEMSRENGVMLRHRDHAFTLAKLGYLLGVWSKAQCQPRGAVLGADAGITIPERETTIGVDVAYISAEVMRKQPKKPDCLIGIPTLVVEIVSPGDIQNRLLDRIQIILEVGVPLIWIVDTHDETVTIYRPGEKPTLVNASQDLDGGDVLPGFRVPVAQLFE